MTTAFPGSHLTLPQTELSVSWNWLFSRTALALSFILPLSCRTPNTAKVKGDEPANSPAVTITPNDVSILFPLEGEDNKFYQVLVKSTDIPNPATYAPGASAAAADGEPFLPTDLVNFLRRQRLSNEPLYDEKDLSKHEFTGSYTRFIAPDAGRLVAVRLDPCPTIRSINGDKSQCQAQLRLIWQPFSVPGGLERVEHLTAVDANIHAAYSLDPAEFAAILTTIKQQLVAAGQDRDLSPKLAPNPLMNKQGPDGAFTKAVIGIVHRYARRNKLVALSGMTVTEPRFPTWNMTAARIVNGQPSTTGVVNVKATDPQDIGITKFLSQTIGSIPGNDPSLDPKPATVDVYHPLFYDPTNFFPEPVPVNPAAFASERLSHLYKVVNPLVHDVFDMDCSSCHLATHGLNIADEQHIQLADPQAKFTSSWDLDTKDVQARVKFKNNLHMFSYFTPSGGSLPIATIQPRVINETALVVDFINKNVP